MKARKTYKEVCNFVEKLGGGGKVYLLNAKFVFLLLSAVKRVIANLLNRKDHMRVSPNHET